MDTKGIIFTTCEEFSKMFNELQWSIDVIGRFAGHDGSHIWLQLAGCGESDSHLIQQFHGDPQWMNRNFNGRTVRVRCERRFDYVARQWRYDVSLHSVMS